MNEHLLKLKEWVISIQQSQLQLNQCITDNKICKYQSKTAYIQNFVIISLRVKHLQQGLHCSMLPEAGAESRAVSGVVAEVVPSATGSTLVLVAVSKVVRGG